MVSEMKDSFMNMSLYAYGLSEPSSWANLYRQEEYSYPSVHLGNVESAGLFAVQLLL